MEPQEVFYCVVQTEAYFINNRPQFAVPIVRAVTKDAKSVRGEVIDAQREKKGCFVSVWRNGRTGDAVLLAAFDQNGELDYEAIANAWNHCTAERRFAKYALNAYAHCKTT